MLSAIGIRGVIVQWVREGQVGVFPGRTLLWTNTHRKDIHHVIDFCTLRVKAKRRAEAPHLHLSPPGVDTDGKPRTIAPPGIKSGTAAQPVIQGWKLRERKSCTLS